MVDPRRATAAAFCMCGVLRTNFKLNVHVESSTRVTKSYLLALGTTQIRKTRAGCDALLVHGQLAVAWLG